MPAGTAVGGDSGAVRCCGAVPGVRVPQPVPGAGGSGLVFLLDEVPQDGCVKEVGPVAGAAPGAGPACWTRWVWGGHGAITGMSALSEGPHPLGQDGMFGAGVGLDVHETAPEPSSDVEPGVSQAPVEPWSGQELEAFVDEGVWHILLTAHIQHIPRLQTGLGLVAPEDMPFKWDPKVRDEVRSHFKAFAEDNQAAIRAAGSLCEDYDHPGMIARAFWRQNTHRGGGFDADERLGEVGQLLAKAATSMIGYNVRVNDGGLLDVH